MKIVIVGCGRVGASIADAYDRSGHEVLVIDSVTVRLRPPAGVVRRDRRSAATARTRTSSSGPGVDGADVFLALTEGDNRNVMAAQLANEALGIEQGHRQDQRSAAGQGLCGARHRDAVPDRADGRCRRSLPRPAAVGPARDARRRPATTTSTSRAGGLVLAGHRPAATQEV